MFITTDDCKVYIKGSRLEQLLDGEPTAFDDAVATAQSIVRDALYSRYDVNAIYAQTGTNRHHQVVRWITVLTLYYLYERVPDKLVPDRVVKNYDDVREDILQVEDGKKSMDLPLLNNSEAAPLTKFRWGSNNPRTH